MVEAVFIVDEGFWLKVDFLKPNTLAFPFYALNQFLFFSKTISNDCGSIQKRQVTRPAFFV